MNAVAESPNVSHSEEEFASVIRGPYEFWSRERLPDDVANRLVGLVRAKIELSVSPDEDDLPVLRGRTHSQGVDVEGMGRVFVKKYAHGGLLRHLTAARFSIVGPCRSREEFLMLEKVRTLGVRAPRPLAYVKRGAVWYSTWLVMEELPDVRSLVEISVRDPESLSQLMSRVGEQVAILIKNRVLHIDLHPGNVLANSQGEVFIVDFDKARTFSGSPWELRDTYLRRWRRAVIKHRLPSILTELMSLSLRSYNDG